MTRIHITANVESATFNYDGNDMNFSGIVLADGNYKGVVDYDGDYLYTVLDEMENDDRIVSYSFQTECEYLVALADVLDAIETTRVLTIQATSDPTGPVRMSVLHTLDHLTEKLELLKRNVRQ